MKTLAMKAEPKAEQDKIIKRQTYGLKEGRSEGFYKFSKIIS